MSPAILQSDKNLCNRKQKMAFKVLSDSQHTWKRLHVFVRNRLKEISVSINSKRKTVYDVFLDRCKINRDKCKGALKNDDKIWKKKMKWVIKLAISKWPQKMPRFFNVCFYQIRCIPVHQLNIVYLKSSW